MTIDGHECYLTDDGTLDTVITIDGESYRFSQEFAAEFRDENGVMTEKGFIELCKIQIEDIETDASS